MVIAAWIFTAIAYLGGGGFIAVGVLDPDLIYSSGSIFECVLTGVIIFEVFGFSGHLFATNAFLGERKGGATAVFWISFLPYILPTLVILLVVSVLRVIDQIVYIAWDTHIVAQVVNTITDGLLGKQLKVFAGAGTIYDSSPTVSHGDYTVLDSGFERSLTFVETKEDNDPDSFYYLKLYKLYKDDIGNYWRSYDGNDTFISEYDIIHKDALKI